MGPFEFPDKTGVFPAITLKSGLIYHETIEAKQLAFHDDATKYRAVVGQVGSGKSAMASAEAFFHSYYYKDNVGFIIMRSKPQMSIAALPSFEEVVPHKLIWRKSEDNWLILNQFGDKFMNKEGGWNMPKKSQERKLEEIGGLSRIVFTSFTGTTEALTKWASGNIGWFMIDQAEMANARIYKKLAERMRKVPSGRQAWFVANPREDVPEQSTWLWQRFSPESPHQLRLHSYHEMTTFDNATNLPQDFIDGLEVILDDDEFARMVSGDKDKYGMTDAIFSEFNRITHVVPHKDPPSNWEKGIGLDIGLREATAFVQVARMPSGDFYIYDEYQEPGIASIHAKEIVRRRTAAHKLFVIDPTAVNREYISNTRKVDEFIRFGLPFFPGARDVMAGVNRIREYLQWSDDRVNPWTDQKGSPRLFISDRCQMLIEQIELYRYEEQKTHIGYANRPEKPRKYKDHLVDAMRFILMVMSVPLSPTSESYLGEYSTPENPYAPKSDPDVTYNEEGQPDFTPLFAKAKQPQGNRGIIFPRNKSTMSVPSNDQFGVSPFTNGQKQIKKLYTNAWMERS